MFELDNAKVIAGLRSAANGLRAIAPNTPDPAELIREAEALETRADSIKDDDVLLGTDERLRKSE